MDEAIAVTVKELVSQAPLLFVCFVAGLGQFFWYKHAIKEINITAQKSLEECKKTYEETFKKIVEVYEKANKARR